MRKIKAVKDGKIYNILVDNDVYNWLSIYKWYIKKGRHTYYAYTVAKKKTYRMHRLIMKAPTGKIVDHINRDGLDNRRDNLRICEHKENLFNSGCHKDSITGYKGVSWNKQHKKYKARIYVNGKEKHLGYFDCKHEAAKAYNIAATEYHKEYAYINKIWRTNEHR